jgi:hypothetical protein
MKKSSIEFVNIFLKKCENADSCGSRSVNDNASNEGATLKKQAPRAGVAPGEACLEAEISAKNTVKGK